MQQLLGQELADPHPELVQRVERVVELPAETRQLPEQRGLMKGLQKTQQEPAFSCVRTAISRHEQQQTASDGILGGPIRQGLQQFTNLNGIRILNKTHSPQLPSAEFKPIKTAAIKLKLLVAEAPISLAQGHRGLHQGNGRRALSDRAGQGHFEAIGQALTQPKLPPPAGAQEPGRQPLEQGLVQGLLSRRGHFGRSEGIFKLRTIPNPRPDTTP